MKEYINCPNPECGAPWGIEEMSFQECDTCGYPDYYEDDYNDDDHVFDYEQGDDSDDDFGIKDIYEHPF